MIYGGKTIKMQLKTHAHNLCSNILASFAFFMWYQKMHIIFNVLLIGM